VEPIKNPATGAPYRTQVTMPEGFEHREAEVASANIRSAGAIKYTTQSPFFGAITGVGVRPAAGTTRAAKQAQLR